MSGLLFVTAPNADFKHINRLLLNLRDWEYGSESTWDSFRLVTSKSSSDLEGSEARNTTPPVPSGIDNAWKGANLNAVEAFVLGISKANEGVNRLQFSPSIFVLLDDKGLQDRTCIMGERRFDDEANKQVDEFSKVRLPWDETYSMFCNLAIGNMDFEDYCDEDRGRDEDGWYVYGNMGPDISEENARKKGEEIERLEREGKV